MPMHKCSPHHCYLGDVKAWNEVMDAKLDAERAWTEFQEARRDCRRDLKHFEEKCTHYIDRAKRIYKEYQQLCWDRGTMPNEPPL